MALTVGGRPVHPLTADDVTRMAEVGILGEDARVELLGGVLTEVSPKSPEHGTVIARLVRWLVAADPEERFEIRSEHPLAVPDRTSLPEPDVAVVPGGARRGHPATALLVVEVSVTSLQADARVKPALYAEAEVPEYWVADVPARRLHAMRRPTAGGYADEAVLAPGDHAQPQHVPVPALDVAALFAGL